MTMPFERSRSLRWMWEYLTELQAAGNMPAEVNVVIESILQHYPTPAEIAVWARHEQEYADNCTDTFGIEAFLEPDPNDSCGEEPLDRREHGDVTPAERAAAMAHAYQLVRFELFDTGCLTKEQLRQKPYVLRHYPEPQTLTYWVRCDRDRQSEIPGYLGRLA